MSVVEGRRGRVTLSIHVPMHRMDVLDKAIALSGVSTSRYIQDAALEKAERELKAAGINVDGDNA